jgi:hypothetical protein
MLLLAKKCVTLSLALLAALNNINLSHIDPAFALVFPTLSYKPSTRINLMRSLYFNAPRTHLLIGDSWNRLLPMVGPLNANNYL